MSDDPTLLHPGDPSDPTPAPRRPMPDRLGRYRVAAPLGAGGMGDVVAVHDPELDREVAAKILRADDPAAERAFRREARITGRLSHPSIVPVHELATSDGRTYFTMKRVVGATLKTVLAERRPLAGLLQIYLRACEAMAYAHSRGVIHRDLKPSNIMVGEFGEVLVMDWGLATVVGADDTRPPVPVRPEDPADDDPLRTRDGAILGTPVYMPPEQAEGRVTQLDERADVYALGAILYELLTGWPPYTGPTVWAVLGQVTDGPPPAPSDRAPTRAIPRELEAVVLRAMARDPETRYRDVRALEADIRAFIEGRTLAAARYTPWQRLGKRLARHRRVLITAATVAAVLIAAGLTHRWRDRRARLEAALGEARAALAAARQSADVAGALDGCWTAVAALDRALRVAPDTPGLLERRVKAGVALGRVAIRAGDLTLAERTFAGLRAFDVAPGTIALLREEVTRARAARGRRQLERLGRIVADIRAGLGRSGRPTDASIDDHVFEAVTLDDPAVARRLGEVLDGVTAALADGGVLAPARRDLAVFCCRVLGRLGHPDAAVDPLGRWLGVAPDPDLQAIAGTALCNTRDARARAYLREARRRIDDETWNRFRKLLGRLPDEGVAPDSGVDPMIRANELAMAGDLEGAIRHCQAALSRARTPAQRARVLVNIGNYQMRLGDHASALETAGAAIAADASLFSAWACRGRARVVADDMAGALKDLDRAVSLPGGKAVLALRASTRRRAGDLRGALADFDAAHRHSPRDALILAERGEVRYKLGEREAGLADVRRATELDPRRARAHFVRGRVEAMARRNDDALQAYGRAIELDPRMVEAYSARALLRYGVLKFEAALADCDAALQVEPRHGRSRGVRALVLLALRRLDEAEREARRGAAANRRDPIPHYALARVRIAQRRYPEAIAAADTAIRLDPSFSGAYFDRAKARRRSGDPRGALRDLDTALRRGGRSVVLHLERARCWDALGLLERVEDEYGRALTLRQSADLYSRRVDVRLRRGNRTGARRDITRGLALARSSRDRGMLLGLQGKLRYLEGDVDRAIADLSAAITTHDHAAARSLRASCHLRRGDRERARADLDRAVALEPRLAVYWLRRAAVRRTQDDAAGALADIAAALERDPRSVDAHIQRGILRYEADQLDAAAADFLRAAELAPRRWQAHSNLANVRRKQGRLDEALRLLDRAIALAPASARKKLTARRDNWRR